MPISSGIIERQEEFIGNYLDPIHDKLIFCHKLVDHLIFYNIKRVHKGLQIITSVDDLFEREVLSRVTNLLDLYKRFGNIQTFLDSAGIVIKQTSIKNIEESLGAL